MASKATKSRLVRCPKCLKLLREFAHLPVYQCGGCGITLKAKTRPEDQEGESSINAAKRRPEDQEGESSEALNWNSAQRNGSEHDVEHKESTSSSQKASIPSTDGCGQLDYQDCAKEKFASRRIPNGIESSGELDWQEKEESARRIPNGIDSSGELDWQEKEESASRRIPNGIDSSGELDWQEKEESASRRILNGMDSSGELVRQEKEESASRNGIDSSGKLDRQEKEESASRRMPNGIDSSGELVRQEKEESASRRIPNGIDSSGELDRQEKEESASRRIPNGIDSSGELDRQEKESSVAGGSRTPDRTNDRGSDLENSTPDNRKGISGGSNFASASQKPFVESVPSKINSSSLSGELEREKIVRRYANLIGSRGAAKTADATYDSIVSEDDLVGNELRGTPRVLKPPAAKSHHAYDASISSNDGWGDQVSFSGSERVAKLINTNVAPTRDDISVNNRIAAKSKVQNQARQFALMSVNEKHDSVVVGSVSLDQDELPKNTRHDIQDQKQVRSRDAMSLNPVQSWLGLEREELKTKKLFGQRDSSASYENGGTSKYRHSELLRSSLFPPKKLESVERDQMELLRKVDELRDQLNKSYPHSRKGNERLPTKSNQQERQYPLYYTQCLPPDKDVLQRYDVNFPRQPLGTYRPSKSLPFQFGYSQMPLSGNLMNCIHHANCSCPNAYKEDWQCLQQLPPRPPNLYCSEGLCGAYPGHVCYNLYNSSLSSPYDQIDRDRDMENSQHRERRQAVKRHCRPMAGGAPFIICYSCQKVLFLPADFLLSSKRCHRLECGSCSKVLVFSHQQKNHIVPCPPRNTVVPTQGHRAPTSMRELVSTTSFANDIPRGDPLSYSEDLELSICKSDSTEGGGLGFLVTGFKKKSGNKQKKSIQSSDSGSPSSDEARKAPGSPLHRLMGYSSISRILYGPES